MIDRYTTPEMDKIWSDENKYETWKTVEIAVTEVFPFVPVIPIIFILLGANFGRLQSKRYCFK